MHYRRMPIEIESPEERGYSTIAQNLTESSTRDRTLADLDIDLHALGQLPLAYGDHRGDPTLRSIIAENSGVEPHDVLITPGAAAALFMVATALLEPGDHAVITRTNYATNIETPRMLGAAIDFIDLSFDGDWRLDPDHVATLVRPGVTKLLSVTTPHNPTGSCVNREELAALIDLAERAQVRLLVDETYRDMARDPLPVAASLSPFGLSVSSMSKTYGLPGIRCGWVIATEPRIREILLAAKEQIVICGSVLDETIAASVLSRRDTLLPLILDDIDDRRRRVVGWAREQADIEVIEPNGGVVAFPRLSGAIDPDRFYEELASHGTAVGEGHWFETDRRYFRVGFGWPTIDELERGLASLTRAAHAARR